MNPQRFTPSPPPLRLAQIATLVGAKLVRGDPDTVIRGAGPLEAAGEGQISFLDNPKYVKHLAATRAAALLCPPRLADRVPAHVGVLETAEPYRAYSLYLAHAYPEALRSLGMFGPGTGEPVQGTIHADACLEENVTVEPGAVIGAGVEIGRGTVIAAGAVIGTGTAIGRECFVGSQATVQHALIGNRVVIHPGARIGQDGFGFALGARGHTKVAQIGRVIIQDDVEIGANTTIDRGGNRDTVIGEGTKIDNLVQIGHNAEVGRHCIIVAQVGIAGSSRIGDFVALGGQAGIAGHVIIGDGAQIGAQSGVHGNVPAGARYGGYPASPIKDWIREVAALRRLAKKPRAD